MTKCATGVSSGIFVHQNRPVRCHVRSDACCEQRPFSVRSFHFSRACGNRRYSNAAIGTTVLGVPSRSNGAFGDRRTWISHTQMATTSRMSVSVVAPPQFETYHRWRCAADLFDRRTHHVAQCASADSAKRLGAQAERCRGNLPFARRLIAFLSMTGHWRNGLLSVGETTFFRPWLKWLVLAQESRKRLIFQWGLTDTLSADALFSFVSDLLKRPQNK